VGVFLTYKTYYTICQALSQGNIKVQEHLRQIRIENLASILVILGTNQALTLNVKLKHLLGRVNPSRDSFHGVRKTGENGLSSVKIAMKNFTSQGTMNTPRSGGRAI
jgi:hypothetical protein